jgi:muconolactone delta-isomerase
MYVDAKIDTRSSMQAAAAPALRKMIMEIEKFFLLPLHAAAAGGVWRIVNDRRGIWRNCSIFSACTHKLELIDAIFSALARCSMRLIDATACTHTNSS